MSLPTWECGLKLAYDAHIFLQSEVTPHVGVWIETQKQR